MSSVSSVAVLVAVSAVLYALVALALARADSRAARARPTQAPTGRPGPRSAGRASYVEVGDWSGRSYPAGAVVVGYDGKVHSTAAVAWAAAEASRRDAPLVVVYASNYSGMTGPPGPGLHHRDPGALEAAEEVTAQGVGEAVALQPELVVVGATEVTTPVRALVEAARDAVLVVVGRSRRGRLARALLGSVSSTVAARASSPVAVVTAAGDDSAPAPHRAGRRTSESDMRLSRA